MSAAKVWTREQVEALGIRTDGVTACAIVLGVGRTKSYSLLRAGDVPFKTIKVPGTGRFVVPVSSILRALADLAEDP